MNSKNGRARVSEARRDKEAATIGEVDDGVSSFSYILDLLPSSILPDIFYRLGIKDIIRCKSVCKLWYKLIAEADFSTSYAKSSKFTALLFYDIDSNIQENLYMLEFSERGFCSQTTIVPKLPGWLKQKARSLKGQSSFRLIGSCNGIVCWNSRSEHGKLEMADTVYVTNPIGGDYIALPERFRVCQSYLRHVCGSSGNNIKVLRLLFKTTSLVYRENSELEKCEIFTVGVDDAWREVMISNFAIYTKAVAFNGVFHWIPKGGFSNSISTFDLVDEKMSHISIPVEIGLDNRPVELEVFNNQFCLVDYNDLSHSQITIWKMREYSVAESWTKTVILKSSFPTHMQPYRFRSIAELKDGEVLLSDSACVLNYLVSYNVEQKKCSIIKKFTSRSMMASRFFSYSPSFSLAIM